MADQKLPSDASAGLAGFIHQLYVALEQCFLMERDDQYVIVEKLGDVTAADTTSAIGTEVKSYAKNDPLTDSDTNFWRTIRNWLHPDQRIASMRGLVLYTTQPFGADARLATWNTSNDVARLALLEAIRTDAEDRFTKALAADSEKTPSDALKDMRFVLDQERRSQLQILIPKVAISADAPSLQEYREPIVRIFAKPIPEQYRSDYVGALFEVVAQPSTIQNDWTITYQEFQQKASRLGARFHANRRAFPTKHRISPQDLGTEALEKHDQSAFVAKIHEIEFAAKVPRAVADYIYATSTWLEEFAAHQCLAGDYNIFADEVHETFVGRHELARGKCADLVSDSQSFYLETTSGPSATPFPNLETPNQSFRNGVIHVLMDSHVNLRWKLIQ